ncbi:uncharacterized protein L3040_005910 [Drepanopeziza brunnea f. sp. 'multigermtubi']|uniref:uncharacterized protein n=1 Tax=Drepanopeziza brunnea f. sp. 'multigermtubi' TaxID=698441 RepID=UPI0023A714A8|nr:hypothetical protein L3040_005910 [Drepanopeziza brunnea f. sp. 'multigermtubi']
MRRTTSSFENFLLRQRRPAPPVASLCCPVPNRSYAFQHGHRPVSWTEPGHKKDIARSTSTRKLCRGQKYYSVVRAPVKVPSDFAFAFDIDGVLLRSSTPLPGASRALRYLENNCIPYILLTNGGGKLESDRVKELSEKLEVEIKEDIFVQSHTPFKQLLDTSGYLSKNATQLSKKSTILVTGGHGDKCRKVAESYGFENVVIPADILSAYPDIWPFNQVFTDYYRTTARPLPNPSEPLKIDAIFVYNDPRDWALDSQLILDLLLSKGGVLGTKSEKNDDRTLPNSGYLQDGQPHVYFSNPDLLWAASYHLPRLGQGAFQAALLGLWQQYTSMNSSHDGAQLHHTVIGKPSRITYQYGECVLQERHAAMLGGRHGGGTAAASLKRVFMVGDNPESDIRGANSYNLGRAGGGEQKQHGPAWSSILVKTGVYQEGTIPAYEPDVIVDNVLEAVRWALKEQGWKDEIK